MRKSRKITLWGLLFCIIANFGAVLNIIVKVKLELLVLIALVVLLIATIIRLAGEKGKRFDIYLDLVLAGILGAIFASIVSKLLWFIAIIVLSILAVFLILFGYTGHLKENQDSHK